MALPELPTTVAPNASWAALPIAILFLLAGYGLGRRLLNRLDVASAQARDLDLLAPLVGVVVMGLALLLLGAVQQLRAMPMLLVSLSALVIGRREIRRLVDRLPAVVDALRPGSGFVPPHHTVVLTALGTLVAFCTLAPETGAEALDQHLVAVARYAAEGGFTRPQSYEMTHGPELAHVLWVPLWQVLRDAGPKALVFLQGGLTVLLSAAVARELAGQRAACLAALLTASTPAFLSSSTTAQPDIQLALFGSSALWTALRFGQHRHGALLAGVLAGAAAVTSYAGLTVAAAAALLSLWSGELRFLAGFRDRARRASVYWTLGGALSVATAFYIKNWITLGNPFHAAFANGNPQADVGFVGPLLLSGIVLVPVTLRERLARGLVVSVLILCAAFAIGHHTLRSLLPAIPLGAALVACAVERLASFGRAGRIGHRAFHGLVLAGALLQLPLSHVLREIPMRVVVGGESRAAYLKRHLPAYGIAENFNARNPDFRVLALPELDEGLVPVWFGSTLVRNVAATRIWDAALGDGHSTGPAIYETLRANRITHLLVRRDAKDWRIDVVGPESALAHGYLRRLDASGPYVLYALDQRVARDDAAPTRAAEPTTKPLVATNDRGWLRAERIQGACVEGTAVFNFQWSVPGAQEVELHVTAPDGQLFSRSGPNGNAMTGQWVTSGMTFYLQDTSPGHKTGAAATIAKLQTDFVCPSRATEPAP